MARLRSTPHPSQASQCRFLNDHTPWGHLDYAAKYLISVQGIIDISVNEVSAQVVAEFAESLK
ncbi:MAG TPA: hypothetical protein VFJ56_06095 [Nitrospira sp.]|nr:hypothetical protein [Nitrospira sp.]